MSLSDYDRVKLCSTVFTGGKRPSVAPGYRGASSWPRPACQPYVALRVGVKLRPHELRTGANPSMASDPPPSGHPSGRCRCLLRLLEAEEDGTLTRLRAIRAELFDPTMVRTTDGLSRRRARACLSSSAVWWMRRAMRPKYKPVWPGAMHRPRWTSASNSVSAFTKPKSWSRMGHLRRWSERLGSAGTIS